MNASIKTVKRSSVARLAARRVAHWSVLVAALGQTACDEDADPWNIGDAGSDASVVADASVDSTSTSTSSGSRGDDSTVVGSGDVTVVVDGTASGEGSDIPDASVGQSSDGDPSSTLALSTSGDVPTSETSGATATSETLATSTSETSGATATSETLATSTGAVSDTPAPGTTDDEETTANEFTSSGPLVDDTSTSDVATSEAADGGLTSDESTGEPPTVLCGHNIDPTEGISLEAALSTYAPPDGGIDADCYPPCLAALVNSCSPRGASCAMTDDYSAACWDNGVSQVRVEDSESDPDFMIVSDSVYNGSAPCMSGTMRFSWETYLATYVWYDGTGTEVATGEDDDNDGITITCVGTQDSFSVNREGCPWLGQVALNQSSCTDW